LVSPRRYHTSRVYFFDIREDSRESAEQLEKGRFAHLGVLSSFESGEQSAPAPIWAYGVAATIAMTTASDDLDCLTMFGNNCMVDHERSLKRIAKHVPIRNFVLRPIPLTL